MKKPAVRVVGDERIRVLGQNKYAIIYDYCPHCTVGEVPDKGPRAGVCLRCGKDWGGKKS